MLNASKCRLKQLVSCERERLTVLGCIVSSDHWVSAWEGRKAFEVIRKIWSALLLKRNALNDWIGSWLRWSRQRLQRIMRFRFSWNDTKLLYRFAPTRCFNSLVSSKNNWLLLNVVFLRFFSWQISSILTRLLSSSLWLWTYYGVTSCTPCVLFCICSLAS